LPRITFVDLFVLVTAFLPPSVAGIGREAEKRPGSARSNSRGPFPGADSSRARLGGPTHHYWE